MSNWIRARLLTPIVHMNKPPVLTNVAPRWSCYASAVAFLLPALLAWWFSAVFMFPKLQQIWEDSRFSQPGFLSIMRWANLLLGHAGWAFAALVLLIGFLEWHGGIWPRYRRMSLTVGAWLLNTAVLLLLTAMLLSALIAAPGLVPRP